ncbi:TPM domain-containing protein [Nocardia brevicatena]|uniref:TPM domain-containing protein n=1 Tax=Nocardia brevicatena TaxID=37327 RepID=UPI0002D8EE17|nr:TPM domain-containing protein [Nocardia brevicatena]
MTLPYRRVHRPVGFLTGLLLLGALLIGPPVSTAEPPTRMDTYVVDTADVLDGAGYARVRTAVDKLFTEHQVRLWVYYVRDFAGLAPQQWAGRTARLSGFGKRDLLLAVAVTTREYAFDGELPRGVSDSELDSVLTTDIEPALRADRWADAGVAAAEGIGAAASGGGVNMVAVLVVAAVIVVVLGALMLYSRKRRRDRERDELARAREIEPGDTRALSALSLHTLHARSREMLVDVDNAVRGSAEELELAVGEFGETATLPFRTALDNARAATARAFSIRQRLDDAIPETPDEQRVLLLELIDTLSRADRELDARVAEFDAMRNLLINAGDRLDALTRDLVDVTGHVPDAEAELTRLGETYPPEVLASVRDNVAMARERTVFAESSIGSGRAALRRPVGEQGGAIAAIREAEAAIAQARTLLDAVLNAAANIRQARDGLPGVLAELHTDLADAAELGDYGGPELDTAVSSARRVLAAADTRAGSDPLGVFHDAVAADSELDRALTVASDRRLAAEDLRRRLDQALTNAAARIRFAADYIDPRRGAVDATARTRLSEAQRHLDEARRLYDSDPNQALSVACRAADLGGQALEEAQTSVGAWEGRDMPPGTVQTGAVLGGILIRGMLGGTTTGGHYGGFGAPSFGGSSGSRRISRGGRF